MQSVSLRIWTRVAVSVSYDDNHYTTGISWSYLPNPSARVGYDTWSVFKRSLTSLNTEFFFSKTSCVPKAEEPSLSFYWPIAGEKNNWIHTFPKGISAMLRTWTRVGVSISYDDNHYTTDTSSSIINNGILSLVFRNYTAM